MDQLQRAVVALAQPAEIQVGLLPGGVCKADELALDFEEALPNLGDKPVTAEQRAVIGALDELILAMSGERNIEFWTDEALLRSHPTWEKIRVLAKACAIAFGWDLRSPRPSGAMYIVAGGNGN